MNRYQIELFIVGENLVSDSLRNYIEQHFPGDSLLLIGDEDLLKLSYQTPVPWDVLAYCATQGEIYDIVLQNISRQQRGLKG